MNLLTKIKQYEAELSELTGITVILKVEINIENCTIEQLFKIVAKKLFIPYATMMSAKRGNIAEARQIATFLAHKFIPGASVVTISRFTKQDHSTIVHAIQKIKDLYSVGDEMIVNKINDCESAILGLNKKLSDENFIYQKEQPYSITSE